MREERIRHKSNRRSMNGVCGGSIAAGAEEEREEDELGIQQELRKCLSRFGYKNAQIEAMVKEDSEMGGIEYGDL
jgi:hypothetical protein